MIIFGIGLYKCLGTSRYRTQLKHELQIKIPTLKFQEMTRKFIFLLAFKMTVFFSALGLKFTFSVKAIHKLLVTFPTTLIFQVYPSLILTKLIPSGENVIFPCIYLDCFCYSVDEFVEL